MASIIHYKEEDIPPIDVINWQQLLDFLKAGYDPRFSKSLPDAEREINTGGRGDALAVFESFSHFVWKLNNAKMILVQDKSPFPHPRQIIDKTHKNSYLALYSYAQFLDDPNSNKNNWDGILKCYGTENGFTEEVQTIICKQFYNALENFVIQVGTTSKDAAMVLVKASPLMGYYDEDKYGGFGKRSRSDFRSSDYAKAVWTVNFNTTDQREMNIKIKRAIHAIVYLASNVH